MSKNLKVFREQVFGKGYNDKIAPEFVPKGYLADALNCFIRTEAIEKRTGYSIVADDLGSTFIQGLKGVRFADDTKELIMVRNGTIYKWTGSGNWSTISGTYTLSTSARVEIVVANDNLYFFDGTNTVPKYDASTITTVAAIPKGEFGKWFHNQLYVAGVSATPNKVEFSDLGDPEDFSTGQASSLDVNPNDGDYLTGMGILNDELFLFKSQRVWSLTGFGTTALTLSNLNERIEGFGTLSHRSIVNTGNDLLYIGFLGDIPVIRSLKRTIDAQILDGGIMSDDIETTMNGLNKGQLDKAAAIFDGRNAWFAVPNGGSSTNDLVIMLDTVTKGWVRHTGINAAIWDSFSISTTPQLYFGEAGSDSKVHVMDTSTSDNGTAINFSITSRRYGGDKPEAKKKWKYLYVSAEESGDYDITVDYAKDGFTFTNLGTLNLAGSGSVLDSIILDTSKLGSTDVKKERFFFPKIVTFYNQIKMHDTSAVSSVKIRDWEIMRIDRNIRDI